MKPSFAKDELLASLSREIRLHYVLLWTYADDEGRGIDNPRLIKGELWPLDDDVTSAVVDDWQAALERLGRIRRYEIAGRRYFAIVRFKQHQHPNRPTPSELPGPDDSVSPLTEDAVSAHERLTPVVVVEEVDVEKGRDTNLSQVSLQLSASTPAVSAAPTAVEEVFAAWQQSTGRTRTRLDDKRKRVIRNALENYPVADVCDAVRGWRHSPHHRGQNESHTVYDELTLLLRDTEHIERFRDLEQRGPPAVMSNNAYVLRDMAERNARNGLA